MVKQTGVVCGQKCWKHRVANVKTKLRVVLDVAKVEAEEATLTQSEMRCRLKAKVRQMYRESRGRALEVSWGQSDTEIGTESAWSGVET